MNAFADALDAIFADANFRDEAEYFAPGADVGVPCVVLIGERGQAPAEFEGKPDVEGAPIRVRKAEIAAPVADGYFALTSGEKFTIVGDPVADRAGNSWLCQVV